MGRRVAPLALVTTRSADDMTRPHLAQFLRGRRWPGRRTVGTLAGALAAFGFLALANVEVTTRQGINFEVTTHRVPLYAKGIEFVDRHVQYQQIAEEVTSGLNSDEARALAIFDWTQRTIRPTPDGWPIVDDHILHIIIRGHGVADQRADVYATIASYAGLPSFWQKVKAPGTQDGVILTFTRIDGRWAVMDVANGWPFRDAAGRLATAEDIAANPAILPEAARSLAMGSTPYAHVFLDLRTPMVHRPLRAELQMPWPRLTYEVRRAVGLERDDGSER